MKIANNLAKKKKKQEKKEGRILKKLHKM